MTARAVLFIVHGDEEVMVGRISAAHPDLILVDAIARLQLAAQRMGCAIRLRNASTELRELLEFAGLTACGLLIEPCRETECPEQLRVQEVVDTGDASAGDL